MSASPDAAAPSPDEASLAASLRAAATQRWGADRAAVLTPSIASAANTLARIAAAPPPMVEPDFLGALGPAR
jgi:hypothetical protein